MQNGKRTLSNNSDLKQLVAREAATLLYFGGEKEFKQAKIHAAETLGSHFLPSNLEVALELDKITEENEGETRKTRLVEMRKEALHVMRLLEKFYPVLIGSVWRGTIKHDSDIDIAIYTDTPQEVLETLKGGKLKVLKSVWTSINKRGDTLSSYHIYAQTDTGYELEIVARAQEEANKKRRCEVFGDDLRGLNIHELEKVLKKYPTQQFIPSNS